MRTKIARVLNLRYRLVPVALFVLVGSVLAVFPALAQEQFYTQSGGRGLQNAKTNARLSKVEGDVDVLNVEMAKVKPHAKAELGSCPDSGDKLRWTGNNWVCDRETDPTVQGFAKKALPTCSGSSILGVSGGEFACVDGGFVSNETDPTVQSFAKSPLPGCGQDQILTVSNGNLSCITDQKGLTRETDPLVHKFARTDTNPALPNCGHSEVLTMVAGSLLCKADSVGLSEEVDPFTADFARKDIPGYTLAACGSGEILRAVVDATTSKVVLQCSAAGDALSGALALGDLRDVNTAAQASGTILLFNGTEWVAGSELDPTVSGWAKTALAACAAGQVLTYNGTSLSCVADAGGSASPLTFAGLGDVNVTGVVDGQFVKYDLASAKWVPGTVQGFAQAALPTCTTGQVLTGDGTNLTCTNDAGGSSDPLDLVELGDVRTGPSTVLSPNTNDFLRYNAGTSRWEAVHDKLSGTLTAGNWCAFDGTNVVCDRGAPVQCASGTTLYWNSTSSAFECVDAATSLGLGDMALQNSNTVVIHGGSINGTAIGGSVPAEGAFTNIRVTGNLYVSGSQSIDGVTFANGGVQAAGAISATSFSGDGSGLTNLNLSSVAAPGSNMQLLYNDGGKISNTAVLYWDKDTNRLSVGNSSPLAPLDVQGLILSSQNSGAETSPFNNEGSHVMAYGYGNMGGSPVLRHFFYDSGGSAYLDKNTSRWSLYDRWSRGSADGRQKVMELRSHDGEQSLSLFDAVLDVEDIRLSTTGLSYLNTGFGLGIGTTTPSAMLHVVGDGRFDGSLTVTGNLNVSGSQSIDGVTFANGGVQAAGAISATSFSGDGSGLTNLNLSSVAAPGSNMQLLYNDGGSISNTTGVYWDKSASRLGVGTASPSSSLHVSGDLQLAGTGAETCDASGRGRMRFVDIGGGDFRLQLCKP